MRFVLTALLALVAALVPSTARSLEPVPYDPLPASYDDLPTGPRTSVAYWADDVLHVGSRSINTRFRPTIPREGTTVVGRQNGPYGSHWYLVVGRRLKELPTIGHTEPPLTSANGRWITWLDERHRVITDDRHDVRYRVVIYDVAERSIAATFRSRRTIGYGDGINGIWLRSIDNRGRAFFNLGHQGPRLLKPGRLPIRVVGDVGEGIYVEGWPRGLMIPVSTRQGRVGVYGTVDGRGRFHRVGLVSDPGGLWSPTGSALAASRYDDEARVTTYWVTRIDAGTSVQLGVPADLERPRILGWESDLSVVLRSRSRLIRCAIETGDCERMATAP